MKMTRLKVILFALIAAVCLTAVVGCNDEPEKEKFLLTYSIIGGGRISGEAAQEIEEGADGEAVTAIANEGYKFVMWSDGLTTAQRQDLGISANLAYIAYFEEVEAEPVYYTITYAAGEGGHIEGETVQTVAENGDGTYVTAIADEGYMFAGWSDGSPMVQRRECIVKSDKSVTAKFAPLEYYTLSYTAGEGGHIEGEAEQSLSKDEIGTYVTAVAEKGYKFVRWSDGSTCAERQDMMTNRDKAFKAYFDLLPTYTLTYVANCDGGYIEGETSQSIFEGEDGMTVTAVVAKEDWEFMRWSDGVETASRTDFSVTEDKKIYALFRQVVFTYRYYLGNADGRIEGETTQKVKLGESGTPVTAVPDDGYAFVWSDDWENPTRQDSGNENKHIIVWFEKKIKVIYRVNKGIGGRIEGETEQNLLDRQDSSPVKAVADEGYVFTGWADGTTEAKRYDEYLREDLTMTAFFEPTEKVFRYDYRGATSGADVQTVTVKRDDPKASKFVVPQKEGCDFIGWYADENFTTRVTDEDGGLMYGYNTVTLETDTLYARWSDPNDNRSIFKILVVVVDEIDATLKLRADYTQKKHVHYKIPMPERILCKQIAGRMSAYLNEWFAEKGVIFEIDTYFTTQPVDTEDFYNDNDSLDPLRMKEVKYLFDKYDSLLTFFDMNDYEREFRERGVQGLAGYKRGSVYLDDFFYGMLKNKTVAGEWMKDDKSAWEKLDYFIVETGLHEFVHTVDCRYAYGELYEFDCAIRDLWHDGIQDFFEITRRYLLCEAEVDGEIVGIPPKFWSEELWKEGEDLKKED